MKDILLLSFSISIVILVSCQQQTKDSVVVQDIIVTLTATPHSLSESTSTQPAATKKIGTTATPILKETTTNNSETATPSIASAITLKPLPTFAPDELELAFAKLLADPMNCNIPCWWGAVPGKTTVFEIQQFLTLYLFEDYYIRDNDQNQIPDYIELGGDKNQLDFRVSYGFEENILSFVVSRAPSIATILEKYGQPDEIWLTTGLERFPIPFRLNLVYIQSGMALGYTSSGDIQNNVIEGCFADVMGKISLNAPSDVNTYKDFPSIFYPDDFLYLSLEEATDLTKDDFMQQFSDPTQPQCVETLAELWE